MDFFISLLETATPAAQNQTRFCGRDHGEESRLFVGGRNPMMCSSHIFIYGDTRFTLQHTTPITESWTSAAAEATNIISRKRPHMELHRPLESDQIIFNFVTTLSEGRLGDCAVMKSEAAPQA